MYNTKEESEMVLKDCNSSEGENPLIKDEKNGKADGARWRGIRVTTIKRASLLPKLFLISSTKSRKRAINHKLSLD